MVSRDCLKYVSVSMVVPENVFEGERVSLKVSLRNQKRFFPSFSISVAERAQKRLSIVPSMLLKLGFGKPRSEAARAAGDRSVLRRSAYFPVIMPGEARSELVSQSFPRRGLYRMEGFEVSRRFSFGLFRCGERIIERWEKL